MKRILLAGATGYLGRFILQELHNREYLTRALARDAGRIKSSSHQELEFFEGEITKPDTIAGCCANIDVVISTVGITRQKDGLSYMDVDYQANVNLLEEAQRGGVSKFIFVSVLNGEKLTNLSICKAKELFVDELKSSGMDYCIIKPNGFFSDMAEYVAMAKQGRAFLFGKGQCKANPIHGADLATVCVDAIILQEQEIEVGGPETLSHNDIAKIAFEAVNNKAQIYYVPEWLRKLALHTLRSFTRQSFHGPLEFFLTVMAMDMIAPEYGSRTLREYFTSLVKLKS